MKKLQFSDQQIHKMCRKKTIYLLIKIKQFRAQRKCVVLENYIYFRWVHLNIDFDLFSIYFYKKLIFLETLNR